MSIRLFGGAHDLMNANDLDDPYRAMARAIPEGLVRYDRNGRAVFVNDDLLRRKGQTLAEAVGKLPFEDDARYFDSVDEYRRCLQEVLATGEQRSMDLVCRPPGAAMTVHRVEFRPEVDEHGTVVGAFAIGRNVTDLVHARQAAVERERLFRTLAENASDHIGRWAADGTRLYANPSLLGVLEGEQASEPGSMFEPLADGIRQCVEAASAGTVHYPVAEPDGDVRYHEVRLVPEFDDDGRVESVLAIGRDVTEVTLHRLALEHVAHTDSLTGIPSRARLNGRLPVTLAECGARGSTVALLLIDLDGFKSVNDQHGHQVGDELLRSVGQTLLSCVGPGDTLARLGGDEFAIVLADIDGPIDASLFAHEVRSRLRASSTYVDRVALSTDASIGIAVFPHDASDVDALLTHADLALLDAKRSGRGRVSFFRPELRAALDRRAAVERALLACDLDVEMSLAVQPICSIGADRRVWGVEVLLRWLSPDLGEVAPDEFIPISERCGHIVALGRWVLRRAAELAVRINGVRAEPIRVAVNVSTRQFMLDDLAATVRDEACAAGCDPRWLVLELTESVLVEDVELVQRVLAQLRELGVGISIDDFGTGYSALHYLTRLRVDHLKIDKSFVRDVDADRSQLEIVKALIAMSGALGIEVVAEGIESVAEATVLQQLGCRLGQGFLLAAPLRGERLDTWLADGCQLSALVSAPASLPVAERG